MSQNRFNASRRAARSVAKVTHWHKFAADQDSIDVRSGSTPPIQRAGVATRVNSLGLIEVVPANTPRFNFDIVTKDSLGLLFEKGSSNRIVQSETFNVSPWTNLGTPVISKLGGNISPDGANAGTTLNDNSGISFEAVVQQMVIPDNSDSYTFSIFIKKTALGSAPTMGVNIVLIGGTNTGLFPIPRMFTDTGFIEDLQAGSNSRIEDWGDHWRLVSTVANNSSGNIIIEVQLYPATAFNGALGNIGGAIGINTVWGAQLEVGTEATSYIPSGPGNGIRNADIMQADLSAWSSEGRLGKAGTFCIEFTTGNDVTSPGTVLSLDDGTLDNRIALEWSPTELTFVGQKGGVQQWSIGTPILPNTTYRAVIAYAENDIAFYLDGVLIGTSTSGSIPTVNRMHTGSSALGDQLLNGWMKEVRYYNSRRPDGFNLPLSAGQEPA